MAYASYDNPIEFFGSGYTNDSGAHTISLNTAEGTPPLLAHLPDAAADSTSGNGSTAQVIYGVMAMLYAQFTAIADDDKPAKFSVGCNGYLDPLTGEQITTYTVQLRLAPTGLTANNS